MKRLTTLKIAFLLFLIFYESHAAIDMSLGLGNTTSLYSAGCMNIGGFNRKDAVALVIHSNSYFTSTSGEIIKGNYSIQGSTVPDSTYTIKCFNNKPWNDATSYFYSFGNLTNSTQEGYGNCIVIGIRNTTSTDGKCVLHHGQSYIFGKIYYCFNNICNPIIIDYVLETNSFHDGAFDGVYNTSLPVNLTIYTPNSYSPIILIGTNIDYYYIYEMVGNIYRIQASSYNFSKDNHIYLYPYGTFYVVFNKTDGRNYSGIIYVYCPQGYNNCYLNLDSIAEFSNVNVSGYLYGKVVNCKYNLSLNNSMDIACNGLSYSNETWNWLVNYSNGTNVTYITYGPYISMFFENITYLKVVVDNVILYEKLAYPISVTSWAVLILIAILPLLLTLKTPIFVIIGGLLIIFMLVSLNFLIIDEAFLLGGLLLLIVIGTTLVNKGGNNNE